MGGQPKTSIVASIVYVRMSVKKKREKKEVRVGARKYAKWIEGFTNQKCIEINLIPLTVSQ